MIGLDTNIIVRILTGDDSAQLGVVKRLLSSQAQKPGAFFVNHVVLAECAWVLKSAYRMTRGDIVSGLEGLLETPAIAVEDPKVVSAALKHFKGSAADFPDCLVVAKNAASGCGHTATFDKGMRGLPEVKVL